MLQQLLDRGVDINDARGKQHPTALQAALQAVLEDEDGYGSKYSIDRIRFLLDHGADVNLAAGMYGFPLQSACANEDGEHGAAFLLENCADLDVNKRGGLFGSALQAAAWAGQTESVRTLLRKEADVNARGGKYGSSLNAAVIRGYWDIVEVLLDGGAKPDCHLLQEADEAWLLRVQEECGRGAVERYWVFWEKQKSQLGNESISTTEL